MYYILNKQNEPVRVDMRTWAGWYQTPSNRQMQRTEGVECNVSTIYVGVDPEANFGPPLLWTTNVFGGDNSGEVRRYASHAAAEIGHRDMTALHIYGIRGHFDD